MMRAVYDWTFGCWRVMFGDHFTDICGVWSYATKAELRHHLSVYGLRLVDGNKIVVDETV